VTGMKLKISFPERPIYKAPLEILQHLYYYTVQYGLSVRQFTGAHQNYWEELPKRLREGQNNPHKLEEIMQELEQLAEGADERLKKRRSQKDGKWAEKEIVLNAQLLSVLSAFPEELISLGFNILIRTEILPQHLQIVDVSFKKENDRDAFVFVEPDILFLGNDHLFMVEMKTRGGTKSSRNYPASQLLNYFRLIAECQDSEDNSLPTTFSHLILVPTMDPKWVENYSEWVLDICDKDEGRFKVNPDACIRIGGEKSSFNHERVRNLLDETPIFYRSWKQLDDSFKSAIQKYDDKRNQGHWYKISRELTDLAKIAGKYA
jgi:hypothetical protein